MLVFTRKEFQTVIIPLPEGGEITIIVGKCKRGRVSLGIDAPREIDVLRGELGRKEDAKESTAA